MTRDIRVGIIGAGGIACAAHIPGYHAYEGNEIVAICDIAPGKAAQVAAEQGIPSAYSSAAEMIEAEDLDAVSVCTPNVDHMASTILALEAGLHVLCEKPIAMNVDQGQAMAEAAKKAGKVLQIGLHQRFEAQTQAVKRFADAGELGWVYYGEATYMRRRGIPGWGVFTQKELQGGGALIDIGVHSLDKTLYLMGNPKPVSVSGVTYANFGKRTDVVVPRARWDVKKFNVDDMGVALVRFEDGASLILRACWAAHMASNLNETQIFGTEGGAHLDPLGIFKDMAGSMVDITPVNLPEVKGHTVEIGHFLDCICGDCECLVKVEQVLDVQRILDAVYLSAETGREVVLD